MVNRRKWSLLNFLRDERGGILSLTMITLPLILAMAAIVVDIGILYIAKSKTESAAMYGAEAAALRLPDTVAAEDLARQIALSHIFDSGYANGYQVIATATPGEISVTVSLEINTVLADIIGVGQLDTSSTAVRP